MKYDVIVAGFGTAGAIAAIKAAEMGARVLVLEQTSYPGGLQTGGFVLTYCNQKPSGLAAELEQECQDLVAKSGNFASHVEAKKYVIEKRALKSGCDVHYQVTIKEVLIEHNRVIGVRYSENGQVFESFANTVIDTTAEAVIAVMAGCDLCFGRASDGNVQHSSAFIYCRKELDGKVAYKDTNVWVRASHKEPQAFSRAYLKGLAWLSTENHAGLRLTMPSDRPGIREGRHIISSKDFGIKDFLLEAMENREIIAIATAPFDTNITDLALESEDFQDLCLFEEMRSLQFHFALPLTIMFPRDIEGVVVAGRHIATNHDLECAVRMNAAMSQLGECAGIIASRAAQLGLSPNNLDYQQIKPYLQLDYPDDWNNDKLFGLSNCEICQGLKSSKPGIAVWSSYRSRKLSLLNDVFNRSTLCYEKYNAAIGLALLRDESVIPYLREMVATGMNSSGDAAVYGYKAIYLLGRFRDRDCIDLLEKALADAAPVPPDCSCYSGDRFIKYEYHSRISVALLKIGDDYPDLRKTVANLLSKYAESADWLLEANAVAWNPRSRIRGDIGLRKITALKLDEWQEPHNITVSLK